MFAYIPIMIAIIYAQICLIIMILYCCFGRCQYMFSYGKAPDLIENENYHKLSLLFNDHQNKDFHQKIELTKCSKLIRWTFSVLILTSLIFGILYGTSFNESIINISNVWTDSYNDYETIIDDAIQVNTRYIPNAQLQCKLILNTSSAQPIWDNITDLNNTLTAYGSLLNNFLISASNVPSWDVINDRITPYREFAIIFPVIALVIYGLLSILNYLCYSHDYLNKKMCCCGCSFLIIYLGLFIVIIACIQFAVSVQIADGCNDPNDSIWQSVDAYNDDETTRDIIKYYLYCIDNETITNPLYNELNASYNELIPLNQSINELLSEADNLGIVAEANNLSFDYAQSVSLMNEISETIQCQTINDYKESMINELCSDGLDYWLFYYSMQYGFILLFVIRSWLICTEDKSQSDSNQNDGRQRHDNYGTNIGSIDEGESELELGDRDSFFVPQQVNKQSNPSLIESDTESSNDEEMEYGVNDENIFINIKQNKNEITEYNLNKQQTVYDLMEIIQKKESIGTETQKLVYNGNQLQPDKLIGDVLPNGATVDLIILDLTLSTEYAKFEPEQHDDLNLPQ